MPADFWRNLREDFYQLRRECPFNPPNPDEGRLLVTWKAPPAPKQWELSYLNGADPAGYIKRFEWLAEKAAARLGFDGTGFDALSFWLDQIKRDAPESFKYRKVFRAPDGSQSEYSKDLVDVCYWSAHYCDKCEADEERSGAPRSNRGSSDQRQRDAELTPASC